MTPAYLFINEEYIKRDDGYELVTHRSVQESSIVQVYEHLPLIDDFKNFVRVISRQDVENRDILLSEIDYIHTNYDFNDEKYRILKEVLDLYKLL
jgi:hypothetical protein